jgi:hypothetical protein
VEEKEDRPCRGVIPLAGCLRPARSYASPTRGSCVLGTTEALYRLTQHEQVEWDERDEWMIIKVPKKAKGKFFFVDYCDGDSEDEFHWLEGPYLRQQTTVEDLVNLRRAQPRSSRRRRGLTEFRWVPNEDDRDPHGLQLPSAITPDLIDGSLAGRDLAASPNGKRLVKDTKRKRHSSPPEKRRKEEALDSVLMTNRKNLEEKSAPLHDMTCLGIDTCLNFP